MPEDWDMRRRLAQAVANAVEQGPEEEMNCVMLAGFIAGALLSAVRIDGEPVGITVEPVTVTGQATSILRVTVPGVFKSEYYLAITQGGRSGMTHVAHTALPGYDERQILVDGCPECESRSSDCMRTLGFMDGTRFAAAWRRAYEWQYDDDTTLKLSDVERPVLHILWSVQVMLERCCKVPLGTLPRNSDGFDSLYADILSEAVRLSVIVSKAEGLIRTSNHKQGDELRVVPQWWNGLIESFWCADGKCGPVVDATDEEYDPDVLGPRPDDIPPHQFTYCEKCHRGWRWDVPSQRLVPWP